MKTKLMVMMLMAGGALMAQTRVGIGVQFGGPAPVAVPAPVAINAYQPPCPGPGYVWIEGYYDEYGNWYDGYWALPPYVGAFWVAPRFFGGHFYAGYWGGARGIYRAEPRYAPPVYGHGPARTYDRPMPQRFDNGSRGHENGPDRGPARGGDRGPARGGDFHQGNRR